MESSNNRNGRDQTNDNVKESSWWKKFEEYIAINSNSNNSSSSTNTSSSSESSEGSVFNPDHEKPVNSYDSSSNTTFHFYNKDAYTVGETQSKKEPDTYSAQEALPGNSKKLPILLEGNEDDNENTEYDNGGTVSGNDTGEESVHTVPLDVAAFKGDDDASPDPEADPGAGKTPAPVQLRSYDSRGPTEVAKNSQPNIGRYVELTDFNNVSLRYADKRRGSIYRQLNSFRINNEGSAGSGSGASSCAASSDDNLDDYEEEFHKDSPQGVMSSVIHDSTKTANVIYYDESNTSFKANSDINKCKFNKKVDADVASTSSSSVSSAHTYCDGELYVTNNNNNNNNNNNINNNIYNNNNINNNNNNNSNNVTNADSFINSKIIKNSTSSCSNSTLNNTSQSTQSHLLRSRSSPVFFTQKSKHDSSSQSAQRAAPMSSLYTKPTTISSPGYESERDRGGTSIKKSLSSTAPPRLSNSTPQPQSPQSFYPVEHLEAILCKLPYARLSIDDIKKDMSESFERDIVTITSNHLDIIASYLGCQKIIYMEASHITNMRLNYLIIPTILITAGCSVLSGNNDHIPHANLIISSLTALSAFLLSVISYLKLDAASEAHKTSSHQYDKLQSNVVFLSGNTLLFSQCTFNLNAHTSNASKTALTNELSTETETREELLDLNLKYQNILKNNQVTRDDINHDLEVEEKRIHDNARNRLNKKNMESRVFLFEKEMHEQAELMDSIRKETDGIKNKIKDIKETNQFIIPRIIRYRYPIIYNSNVFTWIKKIEEYKILLMNRLVDTRNHIRQIHKCIDYITKHKSYYHDNVIRLKLLELTLNKTRLKRSRQIYKDRIIYLGTAFEDIDTMFQTEIFNAELRKRHWFLLKFYRFLQCLYFFKSYTNKKLDNIIKPTLNKNSILYQIINSSGVEYNDLELKWIKVVPKDINFENINIYDKNVEYFTYENEESYSGTSFAAPMVMSNKEVNTDTSAENTLSDDFFSILCCCCCEYFCNKYNSKRPPFDRSRTNSYNATNFPCYDESPHGGQQRQHCHNNSVYRDIRMRNNESSSSYFQDEDENNIGDDEDDANGKEEF